MPYKIIPAGKENSCVMHLVCSLERWDSLALVLVERVHGDGSVAEVDLAVRSLLPGQGVLHPFVVVSVGEVLTGVGAT